MELIIKGVHNYHVDEQTQEFIKGKFEKILRHLHDNATSAEISIELKQDKEYLLKSHLHMKWGKTIHVEKHGSELQDLVERLIKALDENIVQEKKRHYEH